MGKIIDGSVASTTPATKPGDDVLVVLSLPVFGAYPHPVLGRRVIAVVLAMLLWGESAGIARAVAADGVVSCCCGPHSAARRCHCLRCPVGLHRDAPSTTKLAPSSSCVGHGGEEALLVIATLPLHVPQLHAPSFIRIIAERAVTPPSATLRTDRPPP
jgi:hypothetical protein